MTLFRGTGLLIALGLFGLAVVINIQSLSEAYGSGPPYFGRTTNMDKWESPLPGLAMLDGLVLLIVVVAVVLFVRRRSEHEALAAVPDPEEFMAPVSDGELPK